MRPNTEYTKSTVSHRLSECVRAWLPSGFKPKLTYFCLTWFNWADGDVLCCFNRNHKHPSAKSYYFQSLLSAEQATFILYFIRTHIHTVWDHAELCTLLFKLVYPECTERLDRGSTLKTAEWQQLRITSVWDKVFLVSFYSHTNTIGLPFGVQKTVGNSLVELLSQCWERYYCQELILASSGDPYWWLHPCNSWDMMDHAERAIMFIFTLHSLATKRLNAFCSCGFM